MASNVFVSSTSCNSHIHEFVSSTRSVFQLDFEIFRTISSFIKISSGQFEK